MKVIFLDIDGVMNSANFYRRKCSKSWEWTNMFGKYISYSVDPDAVILLNRLIKETGAVVVLSSTWRNGPQFPALKEDFRKIGIDIFDRCPCWGLKGVTDWIRVEDDNGHSYTTQIPRGEIVDAWLKEHPEVEGYVILDDSDVFTDEHRNHLVITDDEVGITEKDVLKAIDILNI